MLWSRGEANSSPASSASSSSKSRIGPKNEVRPEPRLKLEGIKKSRAFYVSREYYFHELDLRSVRIGGELEEPSKSSAYQNRSFFTYSQSSKISKALSQIDPGIGLARRFDFCDR
jgi:hypothetical protein